jgi:hypothetical protein
MQAPIWRYRSKSWVFFSEGVTCADENTIGRVTGTIVKVITSAIGFKGYTAHASEDEPQYEIKSDKTEHIAMHKGSALRKLSQ